MDKNDGYNLFVVIGCSNRSDRDKRVSFYTIPAVTTHKTRVCSEHFLNSSERQLRRDEVPSLQLPLLSTRFTEPTPRRAVVRHVQENYSDAESETSPDILPTSPGVVDNSSVVEYRDIGVNTDLTMYDIETKERKVNELTSDLDDTKLKLQKQLFRVENVCDDGKKLGFIHGLLPFQHYWFPLTSLVQQWMNSHTDHLDNKTNRNLAKDESELIFVN